jgi:hypothetical protein
LEASALADEGVLVHPHPSAPSQTAPRERAVASPIDELSVAETGAGGGGLVEDQAIGGIRRHESGAFDVGGAAQRLERERAGVHRSAVPVRSA